MCPFPTAPKRPFVPSSGDIPQARFRQIHLPAGHKPCLHLRAETLRAFLLLNTPFTFLEAEAKQERVDSPTLEGVG